MISLEEAKLTNFRDSTKEELLAYIGQVSEKVPHKNTSVPNLCKILCKELGMTYEFDSIAAPVLAKLKPKTGLFPPMNLEHMWNFGGKRFRVRVSKPADAAPQDNGCFVSINGEHPGFPIRYNEPIVIPAPIYRHLCSLEAGSPEKAVLENGDTTMVIKTGPRFAISGAVEKGTEHLPESIQEWYQSQGVKWVNDLTERDLLSVCEKLEIRTRNKKDEALTAEDLRANLFLFLYGHTDVEEPEAEAA